MGIDLNSTEILFLDTSVSLQKEFEMMYKNVDIRQMIKSLIESLQNDEEDIKVLLDEDLDEDVIKKAVESLPNLILNLGETSDDVFIRLMKKIRNYIQDRGMINKVPFTWLELLLDEYTPYMVTLPSCKEDMKELYKMISAHNETYDLRLEIQKELNALLGKGITNDILSEDILQQVIQLAEKTEGMNIKDDYDKIRDIKNVGKTDNGEITEKDEESNDSSSKRKETDRSSIILPSKFPKLDSDVAQKSLQNKNIPAQAS